jgi:aminomethyltransferase
MELTKKLIGLIISERGIPRSDYKIYDVSNHEIGYITSGTHSPSLEKGIGLGYIKSRFSSIGTKIYIEIRNKKVEATIVNLPFVK